MAHSTMGPVGNPSRGRIVRTPRSPHIVGTDCRPTVAGQPGVSRTSDFSTRRAGAARRRQNRTLAPANIRAEFRSSARAVPVVGSPSQRWYQESGWPANVCLPNVDPTPMFVNGAIAYRADRSGRNWAAFCPLLFSRRTVHGTFHASGRRLGGIAPNRRPRGARSGLRIDVR